jgi:hypothetical protein
MATNVQVYQEPDGTSWSVRVVGEEETEPKRFDSRDQAVEEGRRLADERGGELVIHDESGETEAKE